MNNLDNYVKLSNDIIKNYQIKKEIFQYYKILMILLNLLIH